VACALIGEDEHGDPAAGAGRRGGRGVQGLTLLLPAGIVLAPLRAHLLSLDPWRAHLLSLDPWRAHLLSLDPWRAPRRGGGPRGGGAAAPVGRGAPCGTQVAPHAVVVPALRAVGTVRGGHGARWARCAARRTISWLWTRRCRSRQAISASGASPCSGSGAGGAVAAATYACLASVDATSPRQGPRRSALARGAPLPVPAAG